MTWTPHRCLLYEVIRTTLIVVILGRLNLEDGRVLVVYYYVYSDGHRGIEGTIVEEAS